MGAKGVAKGRCMDHQEHFIQLTPSDDVIARLDSHPTRMPSLYHYGDDIGKKSRAPLQASDIKISQNLWFKFLLNYAICAIAQRANSVLK
jgi:hypothetical protein